MTAEHVACALVFACALAAICFAPRNRPHGSAGPAALGLGVLFLLSLAISAARGADAYASLERVLQLTGWFLFALGIGLVGIRGFETAWLIFATALSFFEFFGASLPFWREFHGVWAGVLLSAVPAACRRARASENPLPYLTVIFILTAGVVAGRSYAAVLLLVGYFCFDAWRVHPQFRVHAAVASLIIAGLVLHFLGPLSVFDFSDPSNPLRRQMECWKVAGSEFRSSRIWGVGPGNFELMAAMHSSGLAAPKFAQGAPMTLLAESGLAGFSAGTALMAFFGVWMARRNPPSAAGLTLFMLYSLVSAVFEVWPGCTLFFLLLGVSVSESPPPRSVNFVRPAAGVLSTAGLLFSLALAASAAYHANGLDLLRHPDPGETRLNLAASYFEKASRIWPGAREDAAQGRIEFMLAASADAASPTRRERLQTARRYFASAVRKSPETPAYRVALAEVLLALGERRLAAFQFREAARLDPRGVYVGKFLRILEEMSDV